MFTQVINQPALTGIQSVVRALFGLDETGRSQKRRRGQNAVRTKEIYKELEAAGDRLLDVLRLEQAAADLDLSEVPPEDLVRLQYRRAAIERLVEEYVGTINKWREAIERGCRE